MNRSLDYPCRRNSKPADSVRWSCPGNPRRLLVLIVAMACPVMIGCYPAGQGGFFDEFQINPLVTRRVSTEPRLPDGRSVGEEAGYRYERTADIRNSQSSQPIRRAAWQESDVPDPVQDVSALPSEASPAQFEPRPAAQQLLTDRRLPRNASTDFVADEMARSLPKSATELVIELNSQMVTLREEILQLRHTVEKVRNENLELRGERSRLNERLAILERDLDETRQAELKMRTRFESLNQRIQQFNQRRQEQITNLNRIIDQLENQLQAPESPPRSPGTNPYRKTTAKPDEAVP